MAFSAKRHEVDMTQGSIWRHLLFFALPLMVGNVFQQLYNTVDSVVVGNFVGTQALAAVGTVGPIINTLVGFFSGFSVGVSVVISQRFGARDAKGVHDAVHTSLLTVLIMSVFFTGIGLALVRPMLRLMHTPDDVIGMSQQYLTIYFGGMVGLMLYNTGAGILRAVGDSRRPLYFLIFCTVTNTVLDLVFVVCFHWDVAGVAWATVISQLLSAALVLWVLMRTDGVYRLTVRDLRIDRLTLRGVIVIGLPTAIQQALTAFSNVFVQSYINQFGSACMAGWSSYGKVDQFALLPMSSISAAETTFVGQNLGAEKLGRAKKGVRTALGLSLLSVLALVIPLFILAPQLISLFDSTPDVVRYGTLFARLLSPFYLLVCFYECYGGALRGAGESRIPMVLLLSGFVVARQIYLFFVSRAGGGIVPIALGYPLGWCVCALGISLYYHFGNWEHRLLVVTKE